MIDWIVNKRLKEIDDLSKELRNVFCSAAKYNNFRTTLYCLENSIEINFKDRHGNTPLINATNSGYYYLVQFFSWFENIDLNCKNKIG